MTTPVDQKLDQIQAALTKITGALNAQIEFTKQIERRLEALETPIIPTTTTIFAAPQNEQDLKDISRLPDCVKELQQFDGNPTQYISWVHNVENILRDYNVVRTKPIYRAILQHIRQKIRGNADAALISYNIFDDEWPAIKKCLSLHYADKRDLRTLEHQLNNLVQKNMTIDEFYANVNHQFSLIVNKIKTEDYSTETINVLVENYRNRALDVFVRGLNGELSRMLIIQKPNTLPEAYGSCLEIQNMNFRNLTIQKRNVNNSITAPINQFSYINPQNPRINNSVNQVSYTNSQNPRVIHNSIPPQRKNMVYNNQHYNTQTSYNNQNLNQQIPPRPIYPKPATPMEIDPSIQTKRVNYMNRPAYQNNQPPKIERPNYGESQKQQRIYHLETQEEEEYNQLINEQTDIETFEDESEETNSEVNFMEKASLAYHT